jgi:hypothetical protein
MAADAPSEGTSTTIRPTPSGWPLNASTRISALAVRGFPKSPSASKVSKIVAGGANLFVVRLGIVNLGNKLEEINVY